MINITDLKDIMGGATGVKDLCTSPYINPFSKRKPVAYDSDTYVSAEQMRSINYGVTPLSDTTLQGLYNKILNNGYDTILSPYDYFGVCYARPERQMRLTDFEGYYHNAKNPAPNAWGNRRDIHFTFFGDDEEGYVYDIASKKYEGSDREVGYTEYYGNSTFRRCLAFIDGQDRVRDWCSDTVNFKRIMDGFEGKLETFKIMEFVCECEHKEIGESIASQPSMFYALPVAIYTYAYLYKIASINGFNPDQLPNTYMKGEVDGDNATFTVRITLTPEQYNGEVSFEYAGGISVGYSTDINEIQTGVRRNWYEVANIYDIIWYGNGTIDISSPHKKATYINDVLTTDETLTFHGFALYYYNSEDDSYRYYTVESNVLEIEKTVTVPGLQQDLAINNYVVLGLATYNFIIKKIVIGSVL